MAGRVRDAQLWLGPCGTLEVKYMYKFEMSKERLGIYVTGLDSAVKVAASSLAQGNSLLALRQLLPKLIEIDKEAQFLDNAIDEVDKLVKQDQVNANTSN